MKPKTYISYICIPAVFAAGVFVYALKREEFSIEMLSSVLLLGFLFYAAPYLLWAAIVAISKPSNIVAHSGFIACTTALALIASVWFFPPDPSGLPMQWMLYWPLSIVLLVIIPATTSIYRRSKCA